MFWFPACGNTIEDLNDYLTQSCQVKWTPGTTGMSVTGPWTIGVWDGGFTPYLRFFFPDQTTAQSVVLSLDPTGCSTVDVGIFYGDDGVNWLESVEVIIFAFWKNSLTSSK